MQPALAEAVRLVRKSDAVTAPAGLARERIDGGVVESLRAYPSYWHGNRIVLDRPPLPEEIERWRERHVELFAWREWQYPAVVTWYDRPDAAEPDGADEVHTALLAPRTPIDVPSPAALQPVDLAGDALWRAAGDLSCAVHPEFGEAFNRWRLATLRELVESGRGRYRGLLEPGGELVAALGAFHGDGVGRFANVETAAAFRRRGCAAYLVTAALRELREHVADTIIVADTESPAERLYRALGFVPILSIRSIQR